jgi:hypothetical protein
VVLRRIHNLTGLAPVLIREGETWIDIPAPTFEGHSFIAQMDILT